MTTFEELEAVELELAEMLDEPEGEPAEAIAEIQRLTREASEIAERLTVEDFDAHYETEQG